ncbi:MAG: TonB C-terminal domain-containing protein [Sulfurimonas sp.]|uniref:TonB C-terminal domain-containing protein n=1 Tax=Sulfurimonas sp. TaxID=2022749 RepID=UPI0028CEA8A4|nr:TonB C-terminal domain-containing protein [Sulfurimonas sp.]MDT8338577.1 TonB C-terminal domain-containing protein [Sulfurimonas sp.]
MDNKNSYFYISGAISLSLFLFFSLLFLIFITSSKETKSFAMKKENYISISMDIPKIQTSSAKKSVDTPIKKEEDIKPVLKEDAKPETTKTVEKKERSVEELFSDVWTQDIKKTQEVKKPKTDKRVLDEIQRKIQKSDTNRAESISQKIQSMDAQKTEDESSKSSTATEVNEYLAKIQALVYEYFYPPKNSQGNGVTAVIELSAMGKVIDFRILAYSDNEALNRECDKIKDRLSSILFPKSPSNSSGRYKIILISEE